MGLIQFSEDISWKEAELKRMLLFIRKYDSKKIKEQAEMSILKELASIQEEKGDAQKELEYIEQALTLVKESRTMRGLAELHFKKAGLLKRADAEKQGHAAEISKTMSGGTYDGLLYGTCHGQCGTGAKNKNDG